MRLSLALIAPLALAACDSGSVPPPGTEPLRASEPVLAPKAIELRADGLAVGSEAFYYAAGENEIETALTAALGDPQKRFRQDECGAGAMEFVTFPGGLAVHFQKGSLVGWNQRPVEEGDHSISVVGDVQVGMAQAEAEASKGFQYVADSTLGQEFAIGDRLGGFIEDGAVSMLYAGTQCFFR